MKHGHSVVWSCTSLWLIGWTWVRRCACLSTDSCLFWHVADPLGDGARVLEDRPPAQLQRLLHDPQGDHPPYYRDPPSSLFQLIRLPPPSLALLAHDHARATPATTMSLPTLSLPPSLSPSTFHLPPSGQAHGASGRVAPWPPRSRAEGTDSGVELPTSARRRHPVGRQANHASDGQVVGRQANQP